MASGGRVFAGTSNVTHMLQNDSGFPSSHDSLLFSGTSSSSSSSTFHGGSRSMFNFANVHGGVSMPAAESSFFRPFEQEENCDVEEFDEYLRHPEKKRRLTGDQVQFLEKSFEVENKLEPERKVQLAKDLGLQPRQVAIWFQNRRARWKTKQLEKDYDALRASYNTLKTNYERMLKEKENLKTEVLTLTNQQSLKEKENKESSELLPNPNSVNSEEEEEEEKPLNAASTVVCKQEDLSSVNSDVVDSSSSPRYNEGVQSSQSVVEPATSSHAFELDQHSELSQDDQEDNFSQRLQQVPSSSIYNFPKFEDSVYTNPHANSCNYEFLAEEQPGWFWPY